MTPDPVESTIEETAIAWLMEREDGFSPAREREFAQWLRADARHAAAIARLQQTFGLLGELPEFRAEINVALERVAPVVPFVPAPGASSGQNSRQRSRGLLWSGIAAACVIAGFFGWRALSPRAVETYYATTVAGYQRARLLDGSTLELNSASAVRVHFSAAERQVKIETGEAHFDVAHDAARPFVVRAGEVFVRAVGTSFNVHLSPDGGVEVIVSEGKVRVGRGDPLAASIDASPLVAAGERLVLPSRQALPAVEKVTAGGLQAALAWRDPLAEFADAPLSEVIARFNARNRVQLVLADPELARRPIGGTFPLNQAEAFVRVLELQGEIVGERRGENEIVLRRAR